ncbi:MAG: hypothetical protein AAGG68_17565 [Bacteroidota bacterium]
MSKSLPSDILFISFSTLLGGIIGILTSKYLVPKDDGLAAGAIVLFYGAIRLAVGLILALILRKRISDA